MVALGAFATLPQGTDSSRQENSQRVCERTEVSAMTLDTVQPSLLSAELSVILLLSRRVK